MHWKCHIMAESSNFILRKLIVFTEAEYKHIDDNTFCTYVMKILRNEHYMY